MNDKNSIIKTHEIKYLIDKILNQEGKLRKGNSQSCYYCPWCNHQKRKLEISIDGDNFGYYHCWVCNTSGKSLKTLFSKLKVKDLYFDELNRILGKNWKFNDINNNFNLSNNNLSLPDEFISLSKPNIKNSMEYGIAMSYLKERNILMDDIFRYNIGYCENGNYKQRVIIPSYDKDGCVNFFACRSYNKGTYLKYMFPEWSKNIIGFELFINWNEEINIVESPFNAITIRNNSIPLFGKTISNKLMESIIKNKVKRVNVCLDKDAKKDSIKLCEKLIKLGIDTYFVELTKKDPNEIGFESMIKLIKSSKRVDFDFLIKNKMM